MSTTRYKIRLWEYDGEVSVANAVTFDSFEEAKARFNDLRVSEEMPCVEFIKERIANGCIISDEVLNVRQFASVFDAIFEKLRVFGGDISGFFVIQQDGESGLPFVFAAIKGNFGGVLVERFVLPVQAAQYRLAAFTTVLKGNASNLRCYKFVWAFRRRGILILCAGGGFGLNHGSGRRNGHFFFFCGGGLLLLTITEESKRGGDNNAGNEFGDFIGKERKGAYKEKRGGNI